MKAAGHWKVKSHESGISGYEAGRSGFVKTWLKRALNGLKHRFHRLQETFGG